MKVRSTAVAGMFYPGEPSHLEQLLSRFFQNRHDSGDAPGIVAPHAGYVYSGEVASIAYAAIPSSFSGTFVVLGPSHRGYSTCSSAADWETPLGIVDNDRDFVRALGIEVDEASHEEEHSIEVQLPFIKYRFPRARFAPVMMGFQDEQNAEEVSGRIQQAVLSTGRDVRVVASSDFSHYVPAEVARENDLYAIEALKTLDHALFYRRVAERGVSACGVGPIAAMLMVCRSRGARAAELLRYSTSGDVTGEVAQVVGYAAVAVR
ncbi:MAG: AmmeMemoRadiSam system protein B [Methanoregulaceae archaeon]|nr:AmmeMemoRadiSam system protein B [Methanoregulaceae archaeon]